MSERDEGGQEHVLDHRNQTTTVNWRGWDSKKFCLWV